MRQNQVNREQLRQLLEQVTFSRRQGLLLCSYAFICTLSALLVFGYLGKFRYQEVQKEVSFQVAEALDAASRLDLQPPLPEVLKVQDCRLTDLTYLGPGAATERTPLIRVKGQKRALTDRVFEVRFVQLP